MTYQRLWVFLIIGISLLFGGAVWALSRPGFYEGERLHSQKGMNLVKFPGRRDFGGEFTLVNQDGVLTPSSKFQDSYKLIYFGFTYCPHVCPTALKKMTDALNALQPDEAEKVLPVFISVDPERDTPDVIKSYISLFHPRLAGFTGEEKQLDEVLARYRVFAQRTQSDAATEYQMDHTSFIYLTGPDDEVIGVFMATHSAAEIAESVRKILGSS